MYRYLASHWPAVLTKTGIQGSWHVPFCPRLAQRYIHLHQLLVEPDTTSPPPFKLLADDAFRRCCCRFLLRLPRLRWCRLLRRPPPVPLDPSYTTSSGRFGDDAASKPSLLVSDIRLWQTGWQSEGCILIWSGSSSSQEKSQTERGTRKTTSTKYKHASQHERVICLQKIFSDSVWPTTSCSSQHPVELPTRSIKQTPTHTN
jgi:hypothetical protein